jgi:hypothetical protein
VYAGLASFRRVNEWVSVCWGRGANGDNINALANKVETT